MRKQASYVTACLILVLVVSCTLFGQGSRVLVEPIEREGITAWLDSGSYAEGEKLVVHIQSEQAGYLTVYDLMPDGKTDKIFPNAYSADNYVQGGREYTIPSAGASYDLRVSMPPGISLGAEEKIWAVVTERDIALPSTAGRDSSELINQVQHILRSESTWWASTTVTFQYGSSEEKTGLDNEGKIESLNEKIRRSGANWTAGKTILWNLSPEEQKALCGTIEQDEPIPSYKVRQPTMKGEDLPAALDWRNINGHDWTTPIKDQRNCGSCWDFAAVAVAESQFDILSLDPSNAVGEILSEEYVLSHCSDCSPRRGCDGGWPDRALAFLTKWGTTTEAAFPYNAEDSLRTPLEDGSTLRLEDWGGYIKYTGDLSNSTIKEAVYRFGPVLATMLVYEDFFDYTNGVYEPVEGSKKVGSHAVTIVGWDDEEDAWICKNSWSRLWGDDGWFQIKRGTCGINSYVLLAIAPGLERHIPLYEFVAGFPE